MDSGNSTPIQSIPTTPGTPGAPLFSFRYKRSVPNEMPSDRCNCFPLTLDKCKCLPAGAWGKDEPFFQRASIILLSRKVAAEFLGTFILIFAGTSTAIVNEKTGGKVTLIGLAASSGLGIMIVILSAGHISGAHVNPSLTIAFAAFRHFPWVQVPFYITAQVLGSISAAFALKGIFHPFMGGGVTVPSGSYGQAFSLEFIITFNLMFVVTAVATDTRAVGELAGLAVGATVMLNILIAGSNSGGSMNPVRTLGPAIAAGNYKAIWVYIVGPIAGALLGAAAYTLIRLKPDPDEENKRSVRSFRR